MSFESSVKAQQNAFRAEKAAVTMLLARGIRNPREQNLTPEERLSIAHYDECRAYDAMVSEKAVEIMNQGYQNNSETKPEPKKTWAERAYA